MQSAGSLSAVSTKTVILGIGNTLLGDDGAGVQTIRHLQTMPGEMEDIELLDGGTLSFTLLGLIEDTERLVVIDAAQLSAAPGTVRVFVGEDMDEFVATAKKSSVHEVSLVDLLVIAHLTERLPRYRALIGIQPETIDWSDDVTEPVRRAIPLACEQALKLVAQWRLEDLRH